MTIKLIIILSKNTITLTSAITRVYTPNCLYIYIGVCVGMFAHLRMDYSKALKVLKASNGAYCSMNKSAKNEINKYSYLMVCYLAENMSTCI